MAAKTSFLWYNYLALKYWPSWLGLAGMRLLAILPYRVQLFIGFSLGHLFYLIGRYRREVVETNISLCFPELSTSEQQRLVKKHFYAVGMGLVEIAMNWWGNADQLRNLVEIKNYHYVKEALKEGRGVIVLGAHYTTVEISARFITLDNKFSASYQSMRNPIFDHFTMQARYRNFDQVFARDEIRQTFRYIKQNNVVWIAADQDTGADNSEFVPFFGQLAATQTVASRMAKITKAAIIPYYSRRLPGTQGYVMEFFPPLEDFPSKSLHEDAIRTNKILEKFVRHAPEQYLWTHRRFKTRPEGLPKLYRKKPRRLKKVKKVIKQDYFNSTESQKLLQDNELGTFEQLWALKTDWFEQPNVRRNGWSGVVKYPLLNDNNETVWIFIKRQENHNSKSILHPVKGLPTFRREFINIKKLNAQHIPTLTTLYYAQRRIDGNDRAILITRSLETYQSLEEFCASNANKAHPQRQAIMTQIGQLTRKMHDAHFRHNCLYPKHFFVKADSNGVDIRFIDLEKLKYLPLYQQIRFHDLSQLIRRAYVLNYNDIKTILSSYLQTGNTNLTTSSLAQKLEQLAIAQDHLKT